MTSHHAHNKAPCYGNLDDRLVGGQMAKKSKKKKGTGSKAKKGKGKKSNARKTLEVAKR